MMQFKKILLLSALGVATTASALASAKTPVKAVAAEDPAAQAVAAPHENRIVTYTYSPDIIFRIFTSPRKHTNIELGDDEGVIEKPVLGDTLEWRYYGGPREIFIKPLRDGLDTSLTIVTNKRTYQFQLISREEGQIYQKVSFEYPDVEEGIKLREEQVAVQEKKIEAKEKAQILHEDVDPGSFDFAYDIKGNAPFRPTAVYSDDKFTYIRLPHLQDLPAVFLADDEGKISLVNFQARDGVLVIERLAKHLILALGEAKVTIDKTDPKKHSFW